MKLSISAFVMLFLCIAMFLVSHQAVAQQKPEASVEISYGIQGNFFVRDYDEEGGPGNKQYFYSKRFIGTVSGLDLVVQTGKRSALGVGYARSVNASRKNGATVINGVTISLNDFNLRHFNNFYQFYYRHKLITTPSVLSIEGGLMLVYDSRQTIAFENWAQVINIDETRFKNERSVEGGVFVGFQYLKKIDTRFDIGLRSRTYFLISTSTLESITLTPTLTYHL